MLLIRRTYKGLADVESLLRELLGKVWGLRVRYNAGEHVFRLPTGAYLELGQLENDADYQKYQGRSFTLIAVEATNEVVSCTTEYIRAGLHCRGDYACGKSHATRHTRGRGCS